MDYSNINDFLDLRNLAKSKPFDRAADIGQGLGKRFSRMLSGFGHKYNFESGLNPLKTPTMTAINTNSIQAYLNGVSLTSPIKLLADNGLMYDVFDSTDYSRRLGNNSLSSGQLSDPFTGEVIDFNGEDEFKSALAKLEESRMNYLKERAQADLLLASGGTPAQVSSILKATAPTKNGVSILDQPDSAEAQEYQAMMKQKVYDAIMASAKSMNLGELKAFSSWVPGLQGLIISAEAKALKTGLSPTQLDITSLGEIDKKDFELELKFSNRKHLSQLDFSDHLDFSVVNLRKILDRFNHKQTRNSLDWNPTIDIA
ncbi:MAG: hypothetical protein RLZZ361_432 [Cyanobacteriota bacterium]|jgi:hypothetical protein